MTNPAITAASHAVASATAQHDRAREGLVAAEAGRTRVTERIVALEAERSAIIARRQGGRGHDDDGARLELTRLDLEGLADLLRAEDAKVAAALAPVNDAMGAVQAAQYQLTRIECEATEAALIENAGTLDALLLANLKQLEELRAPLGRGKPGWAPSPALWLELRRLAAAAGRL